MGWAIAILAGLLLGGYAAVQFAIGHYGPALLDTVDRLSGGSRDTVMLEHVALGRSSARKLVVYGSQSGSDELRPVLLFSHGGGWRSGDPADYGFIARAFVPEGFIVVLAGYRLHPEAEFPAMLEDTAGAIAWTRENIVRHGGDPDAIFLAGHSAGAYNIVMTALDPQWLAREGVPADTVAGVIGLAGPYDFFPFDSESTQASFGRATDPANSTQPVAFVRHDAPPMLLMTGLDDTVVRPRNSRTLADRLQAVGARVELREFDGMNHNDIVIAMASPWRRNDRIIAAIRDFTQPIAAARGVRTATSVPVQTEIR